MTDKEIGGADVVQEMYQGNKEVILESLRSESIFLNMNAIICCAQKKLSAKEFIDALVSLKDVDIALLGYRISDAATAALYLVNNEPYEGENEVVKKLVDSNFGLT